MKIATETDFERAVRTIKDRAEEECTGFWFNLVRYGDCRFIQGSVVEEDSPRGVHRNIALLSDTVTAEDIEGFWPEISGHPITPSEENLLVEYLSTRNPKDVELIVPERNTARPVDWDVFENAREFEIYRDYIYPEIIGVIREIISPDKWKGTCRQEKIHRTSALEGHRPKRLLDMGCGCGNLIETIHTQFGTPREDGTDGRNMGTGRDGFFPFQCYGIDISEENVEAAGNRNLENIFLGDSERIDEILAPDATFDWVIFCGLLNRQVLPSKDKALAILRGALKRLDPGGHVIITGYTSCHLTAAELDRMGIEVLRTCLPGNLFKDYDAYFLRQLYVGRKKE